VLLSSTANDQFIEYGTIIDSLSLTNKAGKTVTLFNNANTGGPFVNGAFQTSEFIHTNGNSEPFVTVSVPQDTYTSATVACEGSQFSFVFINNQAGTAGNTFATDANGDCGNGFNTATVNISSPITISGSAMVLTLDLQASQSGMLTSPPTDPVPTFIITPTFNLSARLVSSKPTDSMNGNSLGIEGRITAVNDGGNSFSAVIPDHTTLSANSNSNTVLQGISSLSGLAVGTFVNLDLAAQPDGSLLATRIEVDDPIALNAVSGPVLDRSPLADSPSRVDVIGRQNLGDQATPEPADIQAFQFDNTTTFQVSPQFGNVQTLPFAASFNGSNLIAGQNISVTSPAISFTAPIVTMATTITLIPMTINGTITSISTDQGF
jgi:hypothetical protein